MGVLNARQLQERMRLGDYEKKLLVTPLLSERQIGPASIDIRLGSSIIIPRKTYVAHQDVTERARIDLTEHKLYEKTRLLYGSRFMLHPRQLILAVTFEYISLPADIFCMIMSRSSWGRLGLVVATAAAVQPGYKGCLTLELVNLSESPISLYPGLPVGQLVFHEVPAKGAEIPYQGRYDCPTEAELPKFFAQEADRELEFWGTRGSAKGVQVVRAEAA
jgi:dCTP deaminase